MQVLEGVAANWLIEENVYFSSFSANEEKKLHQMPLTCLFILLFKKKLTDITTTLCSETFLNAFYDFNSHEKLTKFRATSLCNMQPTARRAIII